MKAFNRILVGWLLIITVALSYQVLENNKRFNQIEERLAQVEDQAAYLCTHVADLNMSACGIKAMDEFKKVFGGQ